MDFPFEMKELDVVLVAGGSPLRVTEVTVEEGMSEITRVTAMVSSPTDIEFEPLLDEPASLAITSGGIPIRNFELRLEQAKFAGFVDKTIRYEVGLRPSFHFVAFRKNTRKFRDETSEKIISKVLSESGVAHSWNNTRKTESRPYTVQYRETDQDFVKRILEHEGIYFTFDDDGTMQLGDESSSLPEIPGVFDLRETSEAGVHDKPGITQLERGAKFNSGAAAVNDHNWKSPYMSLLCVDKSDRDAEFETYEYPVGYRYEDAGLLLAKFRKEAHVAGKRYVKGNSSVVDFRAGKQFTFAHTEAVDFSDKYLLTKVKHTFQTRWAKDGKGKYSNEFTAIPASVPFRAPIVTPRPVIIGNHTAMVRGPEGEEIHTDTYGRMKTQFHWDREANGLDDSRWIRALQETTTSQVLARVGWEMTVGYVDGDPERPMGLGRQINGQMTPEYEAVKFKNRMTVKTETYPGKRGFNEFRMDDSAGKQFMDFHAQKDLSNTVGNDKTETIGNDYHHLIKFGHQREINKNQDVHISGNEKRQVGDQFTESVTKDRSEKIGGDETIDIKTNHSLNVAANDTEKVTGDRTVFVGEADPQEPEEPELMENLVTSNDDYFDDQVGDQAANRVLAPSFQAAGPEEEAPEDYYEDTPSQEDALASEEESEDEEGDERKGMIKRVVEKDNLKEIQGSYMQLAEEGQISHAAGDLFQEEIEGMKHTTSSEENISQANGGKVIRKIEGDIIRKAKGRVTTSSKESNIKIDGNFELTSQCEKVEVRGKEIELVAQSKFTFESGGLTIELTPDTIRIAGDIKLSSDKKIEFTGNDKMTGS